MLLQHSALYLLARGLPGLINFCAIALYTRLLAPEAYGRYTLIVAGTGMVSLLLFQWIRLGMLRYFPAVKRQDAFLSTIAAVSLLLVVSTGILGGVAALIWPDPALRGIFLLGLCYLWSDSWFDINLDLARSQLNPLRNGYLGVAKAVCSLGCGGLLAYLGYGATGLLIGVTAGMAIPLLCLTRREWRVVRWRLVDWSYIRQLLAYGLPLTGTLVLAGVIASVDRLFLGWFKGTQAAGLYAVGYDLTQQTIAMLMIVVNQAAYPLVIKAVEQQQPELIRQHLAQNITALLAIALPATIVLSLLAPNVVTLFLGTQYHRQAILIIPWVAIAVLLFGIKAYYLDLSFQLGQSTMGLFRIALVTACANLGLCFWWIPAYGVMGAVYAMLVTYLIAAVLSWLVGRRVFALQFPVRELAKVALAAVLMVAVLFPVRHWRGPTAFLAQLLLGLAVYGGALLLLDTMQLRQHLRHRVSVIRTGVTVRDSSGDLTLPGG